MYKRVVKAVVSLTLLMGVMAGTAQADLQVIGTADIDGVGTGYNLIYDTGSVADGLSSFVWLDYTHNYGHGADSQYDQISWASGLNALGSVTYHLNSGISMDWGGSSWRLPSTVDADSSIAHNVTSSELGHLFYTDLGLTFNTAVNAGNQGPFVNIQPQSPGWYWSGTGYSASPTYGWAFGTVNGDQGIGPNGLQFSAIAVRSGALVSTVPEPSTYLLLGISLCVVGYARRKMSAR